MIKKSNKSCSVAKVALSILGFAILTALAAIGRRKIRESRALKAGDQL